MAYRTKYVFPYDHCFLIPDIYLPDCTLTTTANFTGTVVVSPFLWLNPLSPHIRRQQANGQPNTNCDGLANGNSGCGVTEWSRASYGPTFDAQGGGVFAMKWDETGIAVCKTYLHAFAASILMGWM